jgi:hypothetical protein
MSQAGEGIHLTFGDLVGIKVAQVHFLGGKPKASLRSNRSGSTGARFLRGGALKKDGKEKPEVAQIPGAWLRAGAIRPNTVFLEMCQWRINDARGPIRGHRPQETSHGSW